jgi:hypothetical protein
MNNSKFEISLFDAKSSNDSIKVTVRMPKYPKLDLGGLKDFDSGLEYYHGYSQTDQTLFPKPVRYERDTQTFEVTTKSANPKREYGTQTPVPGLVWTDSREGKVVKPMKYFDSELWLKRRIEAAMFIQKICRGYLARKRMSGIRALRRQIALKREAVAIEFKETQEMQLKLEIEKRAKPKVISQGKGRLRQSLRGAWPLEAAPDRPHQGESVLERK